MKASVRIAEVYNRALEESRIELVIIKQRKTRIGALLFEKDTHEVVKKVIDRVDVNGSVLDIMLTAYGLMKKNGIIAKDDKTLMTMLHWQYMNGFSNEMFDNWKYKNDTEFLESIA